MRKGTKQTQTPADRKADLRLQREYGISFLEYDVVLAFQHGVCAICGKAPTMNRLHVDHCHTGGLIRGLLCMRCNRAIAKFEDKADLMLAGAAYIQDPPFTKALGKKYYTAPGGVGTKKRNKLLRIRRAMIWKKKLGEND